MDKRERVAERDWMMAEAEVVERPFPSTTPLIGALLARFRAAWNSIATKWYVRPLLAQQNRFNRLVAERFEEQNGRLITQDQQQTHLTHTTTELTTQIIQLNRHLAALEERLASLEKQTSANSEP